MPPPPAAAAFRAAAFISPASLGLSPSLSLSRRRGREREILEFLACEFGLGGNRGIRIH